MNIVFNSRTCLFSATRIPYVDMPESEDVVTNPIPPGLPILNIAPLLYIDGIPPHGLHGTHKLIRYLAPKSGR